jgi:hypothetical protein
VSTERDFTRVLRARGRLDVSAADRVTLRYPDGEAMRLALHGRRFDYAVPAARQNELMAPGVVTGLERRRPGARSTAGRGRRVLARA